MYIFPEHVCVDSKTFKASSSVENGKYNCGALLYDFFLDKIRIGLKTENMFNYSNKIYHAHTKTYSSSSLEKPIKWIILWNISRCILNNQYTIISNAAKQMNHTYMYSMFTHFHSHVCAQKCISIQSFCAQDYQARADKSISSPRGQYIANRKIPMSRCVCVLVVSQMLHVRVDEIKFLFYFAKLCDIIVCSKNRNY